MPADDYSPTRTHATWKPRVTESSYHYYRCPECGTVVGGIDSPAVENELCNDGERSLIFEPTYAHTEFKMSCCGKPMEEVPTVLASEVADRFKLDYHIAGGFNSNCIQVNWKSIDPTCKMRWVSLKTFTGVQTKYVQPKKWPPITFGLADEDAFAYCAKKDCIECTFRCKSGMELYAYVENLGLVMMTLDRFEAPGQGTK